MILSKEEFNTQIDDIIDLDSKYKWFIYAREPEYVASDDNVYKEFIRWREVSIGGRDVYPVKAKISFSENKEIIWYFWYGFEEYDDILPWLLRWGN